MRISELATATGVPVHTLKYYLREGLLMPGEATSRTRAEYGPEHLERVRLVRALVEHGGVGIAGVRSVLDALTAPPPSRHDFLGVAHCALPTTGDDAPPSAEVTALLEELGWQVWPEAPGGPRPRGRSGGRARRRRLRRRPPAAPVRAGHARGGRSSTSTTPWRPTARRRRCTPSSSAR